MQKLVQIVVSSAVTIGVAPFLFGTPLNHWLVYSLILGWTAYATAILQARFHGRRSR
jgi:hypothetical protein